MELRISLLFFSAYLTTTLSQFRKCYSCASADYAPLFDRLPTLARQVDIKQFASFCDESQAVHGLAAVVSCSSACLTVFEPHYFGGLQSPARPFTFMRGCAESMLAVMKSRPREVDFLHSEDICVKLPLSQIFPDVNANEVVEVCSCTSDGCNSHSEVTSSSRRTLGLFVFLLQFVHTLNSRP